MVTGVVIIPDPGDDAGDSPPGAVGPTSYDGPAASLTHRDQIPVCPDNRSRLAGIEVGRRTTRKAVLLVAGDSPTRASYRAA